MRSSWPAIAGRLPLVPLYRQKLRTVPFRLGRPVWVDDPDFDLRYHIRRTALPAPGGDEQLADLMARVMSQRLDRDHPLWEYWVVEGLAEGRWALISKVHHCMVDGVSGTDLYRVIFDFSPEPAPPAADDRTVAAEPSPLALAAQAALDMVVLPLREASRAEQCGRGRSRRRRPAGGRHGAGHREAGPVAVAGRGVLAERADRPAAAVRLGPGLAGRRQDDQAGAWRHGERRRPGRDQRRLPGAAALPRRGARTAQGSVAGPGFRPGSGRGEHLREPGVGDGGRPSRPHRRPGGTARGRPGRAV